MHARRTAANSVEKTCRILCALSDRQTRRLTDIAAMTGLNKVSVLRILESLIKEQLVTRDDTTKEYRYGSELYVISATLENRADLRSAARPSLRRLAERTGFTVLLQAPAGDECVCIDRATGDFPLHPSQLFVGSRRPLGVGSGPLSILARMEASEQEDALTAIGPLLRPWNLSVEAIRAGIEATRDLGYAACYGNVRKDIGGVSMAICDGAGGSLGALSVSTLKEHMRARENEIAQLLSSEVLEIRSVLERVGGQSRTIDPRRPSANDRIARGALMA